jgi:hypothetical protein
MFKEIRRKEKQLTIEECHELLTKAEYGTLATIGADGYPYAVSVNYVFPNGNIYFHCATVGQKLDNIDNCSNVSFNIVTDVWVVPLISDEDFNESVELGSNLLSLHFRMFLKKRESVRSARQPKVKKKDLTLILTMGPSNWSSRSRNNGFS